MVGIVYPDFPLISNIEFMCLKLYERGPTYRNDLIREFWTWRKDETHFNYYELFSNEGASYVPPRVMRQRMNFVVTVMPKKKGRIITLAPRGYMTVARTMQRIARLQDLTAKPRTFYVYYKKVGIIERTVLDEHEPENGSDIFSGSNVHMAWTMPTTFKRATIEAKTLLAARKLVNVSLFNDEQYYHCLTSVRDLSNAFLLRNHNWPSKCHCVKCESEKKGRSKC